MTSTGRQLHAEAAKARELGEYNKSLQLSDEALLAYDTDNDDLGFAELLADRSITLRNYSNGKERNRLLVVAKHELQAAIEIAEKCGDEKVMGVPLYNLARIHEELGDLQEATRIYGDAITHVSQFPAEHHNSLAYILDMKIHMKYCEFKNGNNKARNTLEDLVEELESTDEGSKFSKDVWLSGGYMKLAQAYKDDSETAQTYLDKAKKIIDANQDLVLRKEQYQKLLESFS